jgi:hypothetical protein
VSCDLARSVHTEKPEKENASERSAILGCRYYRENMDADEIKNQTSSSWVNVLLGIWLIISPFVVQYPIHRAIWNNVVAGIIVIAVGLIRFGMRRQPQWSWLNLILGIWTIIAPFAVGFFSMTLTWSNIVVGILVAAVALNNAYSRMSLAR